MKITRLSHKTQKDQNQIDQSDDESDDSILLIQTKYIRDLLIKHEMKECAFVFTLMIENKLKKTSSIYK
jgi:hypothetical protein